jgi:glyoxylase-like metal-dependent hydrolase (beta-lactamase superfamily II)
MRVISLNKSTRVYSSNIYLVLGDWNRIGDINTIVDVGANGTIMEELEKLSTGFGKNPVDQVVLTHGHFDHTSALPSVKEKYDPLVYAFAEMKGVDQLLTDGQSIRLGDRDLEVIHTPGHSNDSICLYCKEEKVLFSGDTPIQIKSMGGTYEKAFVNALERLSNLNVETIYPGHGDPITNNASEVIRDTLTIVKKVMTF